MVLNKKAIYVLIRQYSGQQTKYITGVLNKISKYYFKCKNKQLNYQVFTMSNNLMGAQIVD